MQYLNGPSARVGLVCLRPYQSEAIRRIEERIRGGAKRIVIVLATGAGKTTIAGHLIVSAFALGRRALFLAHRRELITQAYRRLIAMGLPEAQVGVLMATDPRRRPGAMVQVASVDTLRNRAKPPADLVFIDECFPAGTRIDGRPIQTYRAGEVVQSVNRRTGLIELRDVRRVFRSRPNALVTIHFDGHVPITCTPGHPVFTCRGCVPAALLRAGDEAICNDGTVRINAIESGGDCPDGHVYNIEVEKNHNYFAEGILVHNCHRALANSYRDIAAQYPNAIHLGLTATPYRADGNGLSDAYDEIIVVASPKELIADGYLVEPRVFTVPRSALPDLSAIRIRGGDYEESALCDAVDRQSLVGDIVEHWERHARGIRTVAFAVSVAHSKHIVDRFKEAGVAAEHLDGTTPKEERDGILARLESGNTLVASNCSVLCEGWDQPAVKCAILARPTKSTGLYLQQAGRILRPWNGQRAIILDHGGCVLEHGLPQDDRDFTLETQKKKRSKDAASEVPLKTCEECYAILPRATRVCPECGFVFEVKSELPEELSASLVEVHDSPLQEMRAEWLRLHAVAATRSYKPGWAFRQFKDKFGHPPPKGITAPSIITEEHKLAVLQQMQRKEKSDGWADAIYRAQFRQPPPRGSSREG